MPRTRLDRFSRPAPDLVKAAILEAAHAQKRSYDDMAGAVGVSRSTWCRMMNEQRSDDWPLSKIYAACRYLGIPPEELRASIRY
jgi:DNA-binding XRE family transcriptional regulator